MLSFSLKTGKKMNIIHDKILPRGFWFFIMLALLLSCATHARNKFWRQDEAGFWEQTAKQSPSKFRPHYNLSAEYEKHDRLGEALKESLIAVSLRPEDAKAHNNLGWIYARQNHFEEAVGEFKNAVRLDPDHYSAHRNLQAAYEALGKFDEAERARKNAEAVYHYGKGKLLAEQDRPEDAIRELRISLILNPDYDAADRKLKSMIVVAGNHTLVRP